MSVYAHVEGLGLAVETATADAVIAWRKEFKPGNNVADTVAEHLQSVEVALSVRPAGVAMLTVQVNGKRYSEATTECFRLKRSKMGEWSRSASSLT